MSRFCGCWTCTKSDSYTRRQEVRHGGITDEELPHKRLGKRDTKRWCKGKVGREHDFAVLREQKFEYIDSNGEIRGWHSVVEQCSKCGKKNYRW